MQLIARAPDTGRSSSHLSSPSTARVAKAESSRGGGKRTGLTASHAATTKPCLALRFQTGTRTSGVDAHRVHALQGCECREKTHRLKRDPVEVMATVLSRHAHDETGDVPESACITSRGIAPRYRSATGEHGTEPAVGDAVDPHAAGRSVTPCGCARLRAGCRVRSVRTKARRSRCAGRKECVSGVARCCLDGDRAETGLPK